MTTLETLESDIVRYRILILSTHRSFPICYTIPVTKKLLQYACRNKHTYKADSTRR